MKSIFRKVLFGLAIYFIAFGSLFAQRANDFKAELNKSGDGLIITRYTGNIARLNIPAEIDGIPVVEIGAGAFENNNFVVNVTIPNGVKKISYHSFYYCSNLTSLVIPDSVTEIEMYAICNCGKLSSVTLPVKPNYMYFSDCGFTSFTIPEGITKIPDSAFSGCSRLTTITIPSSVKEIGDFAFDECVKLTTVNLPVNASIKFGSFSTPRVFDGTNLAITSQSALRKAGYTGKF